VNALTKIESGALAVPFDELTRMAESMARAQLFGKQTPQQLLSLMLIAQANGQHPAAAARDYDVIQGRPSKKAEAMLRDFLMAGGKVDWHTYSDQKCDATFSHPQGGSIRVDWDHARVAQAKISNPEMYKKYPRNMLRARCISEGVRTVYPVATGGMQSVEEARGLPPVDMGAAVQPVPDALLKEARAAAAKGVAAYQAFFQATGKENRTLLAGEHPGLKQEAIDADAARTVDVDINPHTGAPTLASLPDEPTFGDITEDAP
jgi:hypothetical protein